MLVELIRLEELNSNYRVFVFLVSAQILESLNLMG